MDREPALFSFFSPLFGSLLFPPVSLLLPPAPSCLFPPLSIPLHSSSPRLLPFPLLLPPSPPLYRLRLPPFPSPFGRWRAVPDRQVYAARGVPAAGGTAHTRPRRNDVPPGKATFRAARWGNVLPSVSSVLSVLSFPSVPSLALGASISLSRLSRLSHLFPLPLLFPPHRRQARRAAAETAACIGGGKNLLLTPTFNYKTTLSMPSRTLLYSPVPSPYSPSLRPPVLPCSHAPMLPRVFPRFSPASPRFPLPGTPGMPHAPSARIKNGYPHLTAPAGRSNNRCPLPRLSPS